MIINTVKFLVFSVSSFADKVSILRFKGIYEVWIQYGKGMERVWERYTKGKEKFNEILIDIFFKRDAIFINRKEKFSDLITWVIYNIPALKMINPMKL